MKATNIADFRRLAHRRLPVFARAYLENGSYEEETLGRNRTDLEAISLLPRVLNDVSERTSAKTLAGQPASMPVALAPVGACGFFWPNGEVEAAKAAEAHRVPFCLSTLSIGTIEDVVEATRQPFWFQLYVTKDRSVSEALIHRAKNAGCSALVLNMDVHARSQRHAEQRHGLMSHPKIGPSMIFDALAHPRWLFPMMRSKRRTFGNLIGLLDFANNVPKVFEWLEEQFDPTLSLDVIDWVRKFWPGKLLLKGVMHPEEARQAVNRGADGVIVSNHGGRQADGVVSAVRALPAIVEAVSKKGEVLVDGGIRSGIDVLKMLAIGADGCLIGRAYLYGLATAGQQGVARSLEIIHAELDETMALCGIRDLKAMPKDSLYSTCHEELADTPGRISLIS